MGLVCVIDSELRLLEGSGICSGRVLFWHQAGIGSGHGDKIPIVRNGVDLYRTKSSGVASGHFQGKLHERAREFSSGPDPAIEEFTPHNCDQSVRLDTLSSQEFPPALASLRSTDKTSESSSAIGSIFCNVCLANNWTFIDHSDGTLLNANQIVDENRRCFPHNRNDVFHHGLLPLSAIAVFWFIPSTVTRA